MGEAYPSSTGGEIFNCYEGTNRNVASGDYSKASGEKNQALGNHTVVGGYGNVANHYGEAVFGGNNVGRGQYTFIAGRENTVDSNTTEYTAGSVILGSLNKQVNGCVIGFSNNGNTGGATYKGGYLFGKYLSYYNNADNSYNSSDTIVIGSYNTNTTLIRPSVVLACGKNASDRFNGLELTRDDCKINTNFQLASDTTAVNAIDAPADPSNPTTAEQTLATLGSLHNLGMPRQLNVNPATPIAYDFANNTPIAIETDFSITIPTWAQYMRVFYISGPTGFGRRGEACIELDSATTKLYSTCTYEVTSSGGVPTDYILNLVNIIWDSGNKTITLGPPIEQKYDLTTSTFSAATPLNLTDWFRIIGLRFEGTF